MITIRINEAKNLPIYNNHLRKTIISCFSFSSYRYFYGSFKNNKKTTNPQWNSEFNIDLFRLIDLSFSLYGYRYSKDDFFIGNVDIDFIQFISNPPGNQILNSPGSIYQQEFSISSCISPNATLSLTFIYSPLAYSPIRFNPSSYLDTTIHIWATYSPPLENYSKPVEIELLQSFYFQKKNGLNQSGIFYTLNKEISWQSIGKSTLSKFFFGQSGLSQVHSLSVSKLSGKYTFFILNAFEYSGKVTLNFISEKRGKNHTFGNIKFMKPKKKHPKIGIINSIEINVQPNKKFCVPFYLYYRVNSARSYSYEFNQFESEPIIFDKSAVPNYPNLNYSDRISSEISFNSQIVERMHSIVNIENVNFLRTNILPNNEQISLSKTLQDYQLQNDAELRIYVSGSTTVSTQNGTFHDYWNQDFIAYNKNTGKKVSHISEMLKSQQFTEYSSHVSNSYLPTSFKCNFIQPLNLNLIGKEIILIYFVYSNSPLGVAYPPGFFLISHLAGNKETLLFYNPIVTDVLKSHCVMCFRIEFVENDWKIIPMKRFYKDQKQMKASIESIKTNNWNLPDNLQNQGSKILHVGAQTEKNFINDSRSDNL